MGKSRAPSPPDPRSTSAAQTGTSVATALANTSLQNVNRVGADGSTLNYNQTGSSSFTDPYTGMTYNLPQFTATESLSAPAQAIYDTTQGAQLNMAQAAKNQSGNVVNMMSQPWSPQIADYQKWLFDLGANTLDPKFAQQTSDLQTNLSNQGIKIGSDAYTRAMGDLAQTKNSAYNDLALKGNNQAFGQMQTIRNQPLNELTALLSGSQVSMPGYNVNTPSSIPTTDNAGLINANYQQNLANWQQNQANQQSLFGGIMGLGSAGIMGGLFGKRA